MMVSPFNDGGHHLYFDNYYTLPALTTNLTMKHSGECTLLVNWKKVPHAIQKAKLKAGMTLMLSTKTISCISRGATNDR